MVFHPLISSIGPPTASVADGSFNLDVHIERLELDESLDMGKQGW